MLLFLSLAHALTPVATVSAGPQMVAAPPGVGVGVGGRARLHLGRGWSVVALGSEDYATSPARTIGRIGLDVSADAGTLFVRAGFAHHHETPWDSFRAEPASSLAGVAPGIIHRSGLELAVGTDRPLPALHERAGLLVELGAAWLPDPGGPSFTVALCVEGTVDLGDWSKMR